MRRTLREREEFELIGEASNGLEALEKCRELKPDLVVLDIGMPELDGIIVAKRICEVSPSTRVLFLSQESSPDVVQKALNSGALGYVHKLRAATELIPAIESVLAGKEFLGRLPNGQGVGSVRSERPQFRHEALFYSDDLVLVQAFTDWIAAALKSESAVIAIVTQLHCAALLHRLRAQAVDVDDAIKEGLCILVDADDTLSTIMAEGLPDSARFLDGSSNLIEAASKGIKARGNRVTICGERVGVLWARGQTDAAIRLEQLCNELGRHHEIDMLCAYPMRELRSEYDEHAFGCICREHSVVSSE